MLQFLSGIFSNRPRRAIRPSNGGSLFRQPFSFKRSMEARYDAAVTSDDNRKHWSAADGLSAKTANGAAIRRTLRNRARYEIANNSYARGISLTLANDIVGTGPRLQMLTDDPSANRIIETEFSRWSNAVGLAEKLRTMKLACCGDGEAFGIMTSNPSVQTPVQLDLMLVEADQVTTPFGVNGLSNYIDGIQFDSLGNPVFYHVLKSHPGDTGTAWGEWRANDFADSAMRDQITAASGNQTPPPAPPEGLAKLAGVWTAPFAGYAPSFVSSSQLGYILSAMFGAGLIITVFLGISWIAGKIIRRREFNAKTN